MTDAQLNHLNQLLLSKKADLLGISPQKAPLAEEVHRTDRTAQKSQNNVIDFLAYKNRQLIKEIDFALNKIKLGTYGICEETEELIPYNRLLAIPWTRLSIEGAQIREQEGQKIA